MSRSSWTYFKLLIWKNFLIKLRHKKEFFFEIIVPVLFCCILLIVRFLIVPTKVRTPTIYEPCEVDTLMNLKKHLPPKPVVLWEIDFTPQNPLLEKIVNDAAASLGVGSRGFRSASSLGVFMMTNNSFAGVIFDPSLAFVEDYPSKLNYTLRFPGALRTANRFSQFSTWMTTNLFPVMQHQGPRNKNLSDGGLPPGYIREGFIAVQNALTSSFLKLAANKSIELPKIVLRRYPHSSYVDDPLLLALQSLAAVIIILSFVYPCTQAIKCVTVEKEAQLKEAMKIMGLTTTLHWTAWFFTLWICLVLTVMVIVCVVKVPWFHGFTTAVIPATDWTLLLVYLSLYAATTITFCFMISSFFTTANVAAAVGGLLFFIFYIPYSFTISNFMTIALSAKLGLSLFFNTSLAFAFKLMMQWESVGEGAQWHNILKTVTIEHNLCLGYLMGMMFFDCILYLLIALYVEKVMPGAYGVPHEWNFFCRKDFWFPRRIDFVDPNDLEQSDPQKFEPEEGNSRVGIRLKKLTKKFGSKSAVDKLSMNMYEGQITVLLGHNGAGKTTTISMITGLIPPSSGRIVVNGLDTVKNMREVRQTLGFCPQHNILFDELTVKEHIVFYSRLKGFNQSQEKDEVAKYIKLLNIEDKRNAQAGTLSGGMKRKLSVCVALCGDSKVVLCDEPSSGMDPAARRALWDLLLAEKSGRTILLTTHFMDEADVLGDRIAIMSSGKLICSGSSFFLKKKFGAGYQLICSKGVLCKSQKVTELLRKYIPEIHVKSEVGKELAYQLPEKYVGVFEAMLYDLENSLAELDLNSYGISMTTLEDVFMKTGSDSIELLDSKSAMNDASKRFNNDSTSIYLPEKDSSSIVATPANNAQVVGSMTRFNYQWLAMFLKKFYYFKRKWYIFVLQLLVPLFFLVMTVYIAKSMTFKTTLTPLELKPQVYGHTTVLLETLPGNKTQTAALAKSYEKMVLANSNNQHLVKIKKPMADEILGLRNDNLQMVNTRYILAASFEDNQITGWFNNEALHSAPMSLNMIFNAIAKAVLGEDTSIHLNNFPLPYQTDFRIQRLRSTGGLGFQLALNMAFSMSFVSAMFVMFPIKERESRAKLLQFVSGVRIFTFWMSHFIWDYIVYLFISVFVTMVMSAFQQEGFSTPEELRRTFVVFLLYGFTSLPFTYLVSFMYDEPAAGLSRLAIYNVFTGNALYMIVFILSLPAIGLVKTAELLQVVFLIFPNYGLAQALANQAALATTENICKSAQQIIGIKMELICAILVPECCDLQPYGFKNPGIGKILVYMTLAGFAFLSLLFFVEFFQRSLFKKITNRVMRPSMRSLLENEDQDDDVMRERKKVAEFSSSDIAEHNLVMRQVSKFYKKFLAVDRLSLAIERGECFGLLGTNGAGKTTTFKMLTGDEQVSYGDLWVQGYNTKTKMNVVYEMIGYCPQFDSLFMDLTGSETLEIYSLLRGIPKRHIKPLIEHLSKELAFHKHLHKKVLAYSGGNRRKLSTAVALLGNPYVIYLDEPTTGIDPGSRRKLWDIICYVRDLGKGIVLTSHSMEECEALCTRIAIMVNGELKCLGSTQHLKNKFSKGISLMVKLKEMEHQNGYFDQNKGRTFTDSSRLESGLGKYGRDVYNFIIQQFQGAVLKDYHKNLLTFDIPSRIMPYSRIFGLMESNKDNLHIEDYSLSQTTLEQVFLDFAQKQKDEEDNRRT